MAVSASAFALDFGVNIHGGGGSATGNDQVAAVMQQRHLTTARMDMIYNADQTLLRDQVQKINANGGHVEVALQISYQWDSSCNPNLSWVEQDAYNQTTTAVNQVKDIVHDFELLNEVQLRPEIMNEVPWNSAGTSTTPYQGKPCVATITAVLRGMSRAIHDVGASSGLPLRVILGEVGRDFGFLTFEQQNGVVWDVTGFHNYPHYTTASLLNDTWYGPGGPLYQLSTFGKPVHINEFNCGEIYDSGYENTAGAPVTETCFKALAKHLMDLKYQTIANVESIDMYELLDEPQKAVPENRFGLMYTLTNPKVHLYIATAFAGGTLSSQERYEITSRGLLTDAQITAMQVGTTAASATADTQPPLVGISSPPNGAVFRRGTKFWATAVASDNVAVKQVVFSFNGATCISTAAPYQCQMQLPYRRHWTGTLQAQAVDTSGNVAAQSIQVSTQ